MLAKKLVKNGLDPLLGARNRLLRGVLGTLGFPTPHELYRGYDKLPMNRSYLAYYMQSNRISLADNQGEAWLAFNSRVSVGKGSLGSVVVDLRPLGNAYRDFQIILGSLKRGLAELQRGGRLVVVSSGAPGSPAGALGDTWTAAVHGAVLSLHYEVGKHGIGINHVVDAGGAAPFPEESDSEGQEEEEESDGGSEEEEGSDEEGDDKGEEGAAAADERLEGVDSNEGEGSGAGGMQARVDLNLKFDSMPLDDNVWEAAAFLASPASAFVTGQQLVVNADRSNGWAGGDVGYESEDGVDALQYSTAAHRLLRRSAIRAEVMLAKEMYGETEGRGVTPYGREQDWLKKSDEIGAAIERMKGQLHEMGGTNKTDITAPTLRPQEGSIALVTGAARGIGRAIAHRLATEGAIVLCVDVPGNTEELSKVAAEVGGLGLALDITRDDAPGVLRRAVAEFSSPLRNGLAMDHSEPFMRVARGEDAGADPWESPRRSASEILELPESRGAMVDESDLASYSTDTNKLVTSAEGGLDVLVHNAGVTRDRSLGNMSEAEARAVFAVNLEAILRIEEEIGARQLVDGSGAPVLADGARVVLLSSIVGRAGAVGQCAYAATKNAVAAYASEMGLKKAVADLGATVNAVAPGFIETDMTQKIPVVGREVARRMSSFRYGGLPWDVASAVGFLCSPEAVGVSGYTLRVCGGHMIGR